MSSTSDVTEPLAADVDCLILNVNEKKSKFVEISHISPFLQTSLKTE